jgi:hypothetical protein
VPSWSRHSSPMRLSSTPSQSTATSGAACIARTASVSGSPSVSMNVYCSGSTPPPPPPVVLPGDAPLALPAQPHHAAPRGLETAFSMDTRY